LSPFATALTVALEEEEKEGRKEGRKEEENRGLKISDEQPCPAQQTWHVRCQHHTQHKDRDCKARSSETIAQMFSTHPCKVVICVETWRAASLKIAITTAKITLIVHSQAQAVGDHAFC